MKYAKIGLGISLTAALCLMACGDDSGTSPDTKEKTVESSSSETSGTPESSDDNSESSSSVAAASSSSADEAPAACIFAATDDVWEMSYKADDGKGSGTVKTVYEIDGEDLVIRDTVRYTGTQASMICRISSGASDFGSRDGNFVGMQYCDNGSAVVLVSTVRQKGYFAANARETVHAAVKKACDVAVNGGTYDVVPLATKTVCDFKVEDNEWTYTYLDEGWQGKDSVIVHQSFLFGSKDRVKAEQHPMQHVECIAKNFTAISGNNYCGAEGLMDVSASGITSEKESMYESELKACKEKMPAEVEPESSSSAEVDDTNSSSSAAAPSGDMVSCDVPGVLGGCEEAPAGTDQARFYQSSCETLMEGVLGTGCSN